MADKKPEENRVAQSDPVVDTFHSGSHPQRDLPSDMSDEEMETLDKERESIHTGERPVKDDRSAHALPWVDPDKHAKGVVYVGPTAAEEAALRTGGSVKDMEELMEAPAQRFEKVKKEQGRTPRSRPDNRRRRR